MSYKRSKHENMNFEYVIKYNNHAIRDILSTYAGYLLSKIEKSFNSNYTTYENIQIIEEYIFSIDSQCKGELRTLNAKKTKYYSIWNAPIQTLNNILKYKSQSYKNVDRLSGAINMLRDMKLNKRKNDY